MNGLGLFSGIGGFDLGLSLVVPGYRGVCYVEREKYPQRVLRERMRTGDLPEAPIWDDVETFDGHPWRGVVDIITAGFPCQPFSTAARGRNKGGSGWPLAQRLVEEVRPRFVLVENVPTAPWDEVSDGLRSAGYTCASRVFCSSEVGAPTRRRRTFLLATDANSNGEPVGTVYAEAPSVQETTEACEAAPGSLRVPNGAANRVDRMRVCGNAVIPEMVALAFAELIGGQE